MYVFIIDSGVWINATPAHNACVYQSLLTVILLVYIMIVPASRCYVMQLSNYD